MNSNKLIVNEDQGVQYIYERAEFETPTNSKPFRKAMLTLGFLGLTAGSSALAIGQFAGGIGNEASADTETSTVVSTTSASSTASATATAATAAKATTSKPATITVPATTTKSFGSTSHSTQKASSTSASGSVSFIGESESGDD
ncbi:MAG: hypothetical protein KGL72_05855 [Actinomycetales bacterium]|nr:hypothetical protein [Actinomycetales bacterium]